MGNSGFRRIGELFVNGEVVTKMDLICLCSFKSELGSYGVIRRDYSFV